MSLDGLRAWIGEVERKLGMRSRVFLVLSAIAIAGAAAGIYLALDAADESVSKDEVRALQEQVGAGTGAVEPGEAAAVSALKAELEALRSEVSELKGKGTPSDSEQKGTSSSPEQAPPEEERANPSEKLRKEPR
ncbi:MAG TPA: hypothetical protein VNL97_07720 [Solirubrobacterales bacterium]|nr:hypothetical protein [Solirubrobacterales bacterium]